MALDKLQELNESRDEIAKQLKELGESADNWTDTDRQRWDSLQTEYEIREARLADLKKAHSWINETPPPLHRYKATPDNFTSHDDRAYEVRHDQKVADLPRSDFQPERNETGSFGKAVRGLLTGNWQGAELEHRAMAESSGAAGGVLVPSFLSDAILDRTRALSVCSRAGMAVQVFETDHMRLARVATDPTMQVKVENDAFTEGSMLFDSVNLHPYTVGCLLYASRELAEDAPNFASSVELVLIRALAAELDRQCINGSGSQEMTGIVNTTGINTTAVGGAITWEKIAEGVELIQTDNFQPNAYTVSPAVAYDLAVLASGDATNAAKLWLGPPPTVAPLTQYASTNTTTATAVVGDFTQLMLGLRRRPTVEISTQAGDSFAKNQIYIRLVWRGDVALMHETAFCSLTGITS